ncbi:MAG TPA: aminotransferase class I/II-fold pyridoxal phosphate-dependent enzyme, partial [Candidatus Eisenbacteria bacterium]|nr:aminotransferase class I/II-fold pyridoxal phosphate-dependent enzyme [Candidatus Eisenbacteria bacterium]
MLSIRGTRAGEIGASVETAVRAGELAPGEPLPPVRRLADHLGVSPATVAAAYRDLQIRGLVTASGRRGTRVSPRPPVRHLSPAAVPPGARNLQDGNPDPAFLPDLAAALDRLRPAQRLYGEPANHSGLLRRGAELFAADGISPDFLLVVGGALDGIERVLAAHLRPGDRVAVEDPVYPPVVDLLLALGLVPHPLAVDDLGIRPDHLEAALRTTVAAAIVTPRAQNPTGAALDDARSRELREVLADRPEALVIEDDHAGPVAGTPACTLCDRGRDRWAVVRSFSKSLGPDLRLALMAGDPVTISRVEGRQQLGTGWVSHVLQGLVLELWQDPEVQRLTAAAAAAYAERRRALVEALAAHGVPARGRSGLNVWVPVADEQAALRRLLDAGWAAAAGERFRLRCGPAVRISVGRLAPDEAPAVAAALAAPS